MGFEKGAKIQIWLRKEKVLCEGANGIRRWGVLAELIIIGMGGHSKVVTDIAMLNGYKILG